MDLSTVLLILKLNDCLSGQNFENLLFQALVDEAYCMNQVFVMQESGGISVYHLCFWFNPYSIFSISCNVCCFN